MIYNHQSPKLSDLDLRMAHHVPPGGNWRDIPVSIPSERLAQIRISAAAGEGSRSTYYGRLRADRPAYTIGTYYNRPGNGCFLHPDQDRTLSHREAARLQSFPDDFIFEGTQRAICQQIGNAVPPLLAYQVGEALGPAGDMLDVFAGAGGLSLGMKWAGWRSIAATDFDASAVATFNRNVEPVAFVGDMEDDAVIDRLVAATTSRDHSRPLALVGGPPCQGFSTGGKKRSEEDARNGLHARYALLLARTKPDVFIFENVLGLLSMSSGAFVKRVIEGLSAVGYNVEMWKMNAAEYGVPQRRQRVIIVGVPIGRYLPDRPREWTSLEVDTLFGHTTAVGVAEAISDLPVIAAGQDGRLLDYVPSPPTPYQLFMRGKLSAACVLDTYGRSAKRTAA